MSVDSVALEELELELREPFETSFGVERRRRFLLVEVTSPSGLSGWGECVAARDPLYSEESVATAEWMISERLIPLLRRLGPITVDRFRESARRFRGHRMAKAAVEAALTDLVAREARVPLGSVLGRPARQTVPVGVSVGIQASPEALVRRVDRYVEEGYARVKLKVAPGRDRSRIAAVRRAYPDQELWVDANQAYRRRDLPAIRRWAEQYAIAQVEQPFGEREILAHAALQQDAPFRVCLDESVVDYGSLNEALSLGAARSLNVKPGRVGGLTTAAAMAHRARRAGVACWVGGMLESGVGRAHNLHLASLTSFNLSSDLSASSRYYAVDLIDEPFTLAPGSTLSVPRGPGSGVTLDPRVHRRALRRRRRFTLVRGSRPRRGSKG